MVDLNIENLKSKNDIIILCHSPSISWNLENAGYQVLNPFSYTLLPEKILHSKHNCLVVIKTWQGCMDAKLYQRLYDEIKLLSYVSSKNSKYGRDDYYALKKKLDSRYPEYSVEVTKYYNVENLVALKSWHPIDFLGK